MQEHDKVLVICSDMVLCDTFRACIEGEDYRLVFSYDGAKAVSVYSAEAP